MTRKGVPFEPPYFAGHVSTWSSYPLLGLLYEECTVRSHEVPRVNCQRRRSSRSFQFCTLYSNQSYKSKHNTSIYEVISVDSHPPDVLRCLHYWHRTRADLLIVEIVHDSEASLTTQNMENIAKDEQFTDIVKKMKIHYYTKQSSNPQLHCLSQRVNSIAFRT